MGPRPFSRGNREGHDYGVIPGTQLQWGRDLSVAETRQRDPLDSYERGASMGPRPFSRGNLWPLNCPRGSSACFNGAATFQSRKPRLRGFFMVGFFGFNGAATFQSRKLTIFGAVSRMLSRFNGAATFQSRKRHS